MQKKSKLLLICFILSLVFFLMLITPNILQLKYGTIELKSWKNAKESNSLILKPNSPDWVPLEQISPYLIEAIIVAEDARFYQHWGFDRKEIVESLRLNYKRGKVVRGGSTITQQLVKTTLLSHEKSYVRKLRELLGSFFLERIMSKKEILTWYLNSIYLGNGIYGVKRAAQNYFHTSASLVSLKQAVLLSIIIPSPTRYSRDLKMQRLSPSLKKRFLFVADQLLNRLLISKEQRQYLLRTGNFGSPIINRFQLQPPAKEKRL